jgi:DNA-binding SARP family transcriptional activator/TolB-like protein
VGEGVDAGVDVPVKGDTGLAVSAEPALRVRLLGPMAVLRNGRPVSLPPSRKVRALLAYLLLAPHAVTRSILCELLWDSPDDPRAELRWCLSRLRGVLDAAGHLITQDDTVAIDRSSIGVDALELAEATAAGVNALPVERARALLERIGGDFLQGMDIDGSGRFNAWLTAQRHRFRDLHTLLLQRLATVLTGEEALVYLEQWRQLSPYDLAVHRLLLGDLTRRGRVREAEEHLSATVRLFEEEGLDTALLHAAWLDARRAAAAAPAPGAARVSEPITERDVPPDSPRRASIAVMPFTEMSPGTAVPGGTADALAYDIITRLAKLRSLFVIAQGTVFALKARGIAPEEAARLLKVDYVLSGTLRREGEHLTASVELAEAGRGRVVWSDVLKQRQADALMVLDDIGNRIVSSIAGEIEALERNRAVLKAPNSLDAWETHHRGLWHMYRFSRSDNDTARHFFERAVALDPTFSRAHAGLSFTHFQSAFQGWSERAAAVERAYAAAGQSLMADDRDPAAHWAMGRALWLRGRQEQCVAELEQAVDISPNFALAHYTLAFVQSQAGDAAAAIEASDHSRNLSPYDPLLFGMLGARAMALARLGRYDEAAHWAVQAAGRPNAHVHIHAIAAITLALADSVDEARGYVATIRNVSPAYTVTDFLNAFQFDAHGASIFRRGAVPLGLS